jgi:hypothetical protein
MNEITLTEEQIIELGWDNGLLSDNDRMSFGLKSNKNIIMNRRFNDGKVEITEALPYDPDAPINDYPYFDLFNGWIANIDELKFLMHLLRLK